MHLLLRHLGFGALLFAASLVLLLLGLLGLNLALAFLAWDAPKLLHPLNLIALRLCVVMAAIIGVMAAWDGPDWREKQKAQEAERRKLFGL